MTGSPDYIVVGPLTPAEWDVAEWTVGATNNLTDQDKEDLYGHVIEDPAKVILTLKSSQNVCELHIFDTPDVIDDILYRIEQQFVDMANDEMRHGAFGESIQKCAALIQVAERLAAKIKEQTKGV